MFALTVATVLIATIVVYTAVWRVHKRERVAGSSEYVGRHRADERPTMTWRL